MKKLIVILYFLHIAIPLFAQKNEIIFNNPIDSLKDNYLIFYPEEKTYTGFLILLHEYGGKGEYIPYQTELPRIAAENGILTIMPTLKTGSSYFGIDSLSQSALDDFIFTIQEKFNLFKTNFYLGGFSIGGSAAIKYAQRTSENSNLRIPNAIFAIDPPLDFERLYKSMQRELRLSPDSNSNIFRVNFIKRIENEMGGKPSEVSNNYISLSPYSFDDQFQNGVSKLNNIPVRIITEPEIEWRLRERNTDYYSTNSIDCAAFINEINLKGNKNAILVTTIDKGYRKAINVKNPHSWSIADPVQTIEWLLKY